MTRARLADRPRSEAKEAAGGASVAHLGELDAVFQFEIYEASQTQVKDIFRSYWSKLHQTQRSTRIYDEQRPREFAADHAELVDALSRGDGRTAPGDGQADPRWEGLPEQSHRRAGSTDGLSP